MKFLLLTTVFLAVSCGDNRSVGTSDPAAEPVRGIGAQQNAVIPGERDTVKSTSESARSDFNANGSANSNQAGATFNKSSVPAAEDTNANMEASGVTNSDLNTAPNPAPVPNGSDTFRRESTISGTQQGDAAAAGQSSIEAEEERLDSNEDISGPRQEEDLYGSEAEEDREIQEEEEMLYNENSSNTDLPGPRHDAGIYPGTKQEEESFETNNLDVIDANDPNGPDNNNNTIDR
jgi:hypothetical protein